MTPLAPGEVVETTYLHENALRLRPAALTQNNATKLRGRTDRRRVPKCGLGELGADAY